jgi:dTDP-4-dehydrorhamnose 3,5-epimerase
MDKINYSKIDIINNEKGDIIKLLSKDVTEFNRFGEAYFSKIKYGEIKGWKKHLKMKCILLPVFGEVDVVIYDINLDKYKTYKLTLENPYRLVIPPNNIFAFTGKEKENCILNISDILHDPKESINFNLDEFRYNW